MAKPEYLLLADNIREEAKADALNTPEYRELTSRLNEVGPPQSSTLRRIRDNFTANFIQLYLVNKLAEALEKADKFEEVEK